MTRTLAALALACMIGGALPVGNALARQLVPVDEPGSGGGGSSNTICKSATVSGKAFYNDQRKFGRFALRRTKSGTPGQQYKMVNGTGPDEPHTANYLGLYDATVEIYENDLLYLGHGGCAKNALIGQTTVADDGGWSWTGNVCDACAYDDRTESNEAGEIGVSIGVKLVLRYCPNGTDRCFSVRKPGAWDDDIAWDDHGQGAVTYRRWAADAGELSGKQVFVDGQRVSLATANFEGTANDVADLDAQAANVFASIVDVTRTVHGFHGIPFKSEFGEAQVIFPANFSGVNGHSHEPGNKICLGAWGSVGFVQPPCSFPGKPDFPLPVTCPAPVEVTPIDMVPRVWHDGTTPMHEYGHLVNYRAWEGHGKWTDYGYKWQENGYEPLGESDEVEHYSAAFKEQWANFIVRVTLDRLDKTGKDQNTIDTLACHDVPFDDDDSAAVATDDGDASTATALLCRPGVPCPEAGRSPDVVLHTLCDWFDEHADKIGKNSQFPSTTDTYGTKDLHAMWVALEDMWHKADQPTRDAYIEVDTSDVSTWAKAGLGICDMAAARGYGSIFDGMLKHNGLDCDLTGKVLNPHSASSPILP